MYQAQVDSEYSAGIFNLASVLCRPQSLNSDLCEVTISGKAFLWHQIRCIMAVLLLIGQGKESPQVSSYMYLGVSGLFHNTCLLQHMSSATILTKCDSLGKI